MWLVRGLRRNELRCTRMAQFALHEGYGFSAVSKSSLGASKRRRSHLIVTDCQRTVSSPAHRVLEGVS